MRRQAPEFTAYYPLIKKPYHQRNGRRSITNCISHLKWFTPSFIKIQRFKIYVHKNVNDQIHYYKKNRKHACKKTNAACTKIIYFARLAFYNETQPTEPFYPTCHKFYIIWLSDEQESYSFEPHTLQWSVVCSTGFWVSRVATFVRQVAVDAYCS